MTKIIMHIAEASGGVERYLVTLLTKLKQYPEYEHILVCSTTFNKDKFKGIVKEIVVVDSMHNAISVSADSKAVLAVRKVIKHYKPDIVYCHSSKAGAIGRMANFGIKNKLIYNAHGWAFNMKGASSKKTKAYEVIERMLVPMADKIVCISEYEKKSALEHKICKAEKLVVINNGIDFDEYKNMNTKCRSEMGIPDEAVVVGMIGRLTKQKSPDTFVKMAAVVKKQMQNAFFVVVGDDIGDGKQRSVIEAMIAKAGLKDFFLITGWVDNPLDYAACFDVAVLLSRWEGFGLVIPEYMLLGKPIVATNADAIPYVVGDAGIIVNVDDFRAAAESVIMICSDANCRNMLICKGKERVKKFDVQRTANKHKAVFDSFIGQ